MKVAVIVGGAVGQWDERDEALDMLKQAGCEPVAIAINDAGVHHPDPMPHWATLHPKHWVDTLHGWEAKRAESGRTCEYTRWSISKGGNVDRVLTHWRGGSSALVGVGVALEGLGLTRAILCGCPLDDRPNAYNKRWLKGWGDFHKFHRPWEKGHLVPRILPHVRSMSGWTRDYLGAPDLPWLR